MTLQQLQYFLAAVEHGSFSAAADAQFMAQPSLSEQVRRLEDELGAPLFVRAGRSLALTEAGERLRPHAEAALAAADGAREAVVAVRELRGGTATLGTFGSASYYLVTELAAEFRTRHPDVRLRVIGQNSTEVADEVRVGRIEVALVVLPVDDRGLDVTPVMRDPVLYVSADPGRVARPVTIARFAQAPLVLYDAQWGWQDPTRRQLAERAQRSGVALEPVIEVEELETAMQLAVRGFGDTFVSRTIALSSRFPARLGAVPFTPAVHDTIAFITRRDARLSPAARELRDLAADHLGQLERDLDELERRAAQT